MTLYNSNGMARNLVSIQAKIMSTVLLLIGLSIFHIESVSAQLLLFNYRETGVDQDRNCDYMLSLSHDRGYESIIQSSGREVSLQIRSNRHLRAPSALIVDKSGSGDYTTVQKAVDAVPDGNSVRVTINVHAGVYVEKVYIPSSKPFITFQGAGQGVTAIIWSDNANSTGSTYTTASVAVDADNFIGRNISFRNLAPKPAPGLVGAQAVAFRAAGDKGAFYGCGFYGNQDTLNDQMGRHYFKDCYIEGEIDFIFGNGRSLYKRCVINSTAVKSGAITAHHRQSDAEGTGYGLAECSIIGTGTQVLLGRAWGSAARVVFAHTHMNNIIDPRGWNDFQNASADATVYFGEYSNSGPGANMSGRVSYARALTSSQAALFTTIAFINGSDWLGEI